ncbi:hypothetical protein D3C72_2173130 [compost metagenome]
MQTSKPHLLLPLPVDRFPVRTVSLYIPVFPRTHTLQLAEGADKILRIVILQPGGDVLDGHIRLLQPLQGNLMAVTGQIGCEGHPHTVAENGTGITALVMKPVRTDIQG